MMACSATSDGKSYVKNDIENEPVPLVMERSALAYPMSPSSGTVATITRRDLGLNSTLSSPNGATCFLASSSSSSLPREIDSMRPRRLELEISDITAPEYSCGTRISTDITGSSRRGSAALISSRVPCAAHAPSAAGSAATSRSISSCESSSTWTSTASIGNPHSGPLPSAARAPFRIDSSFSRNISLNLGSRAVHTTAFPAPRSRGRNRSFIDAT
mmetsp:Transcript_11049/g.29680  ORF Transcript_11049/g.29680 Transcript_11049/m.29680 type:complete len:216 (+) Transcript_11049:641-1288(+)